MPLLLTAPAENPFETIAHIPLGSVYAIILRVNYDTRKKVIDFEVGYYYSEPAYVAHADALQVKFLPRGFTQPATPEQANAVPIFQFLEYSLTAKLQELLGPDVQIENVL